MPFSDGEFDVVTSSLFVHHLEPFEVLRCINESLRVARVAVIINDLHRSALHLLALYAALPLCHSRLTRHDDPASVRRAYTMAELQNVLGKTQAAWVHGSTLSIPNGCNCVEINHYDLVVASAGPAGTAAAITAARLGEHVALLEQSHFPRHKVCGEFISGGSDLVAYIFAHTR